MDKKHTIVIIGGMGAIGRNLIEYLVEFVGADPENIKVLDNLSSSNETHCKLDYPVKYEHVDIRDYSKLYNSIPQETKYIYHLAAHFANQNSVEHPVIDLETNVKGTIHLLDCASRLPNLKKFVYASSSCVYGSGGSVYGGGIMSESDSIYPTETPYAINKLAAEMYCDFYKEHHGVPTIAIRIFNTYGKYEKAGRYRNVIPNFIENALKGETINITGDGTETRDFTYALDTSQLLYKASISDKSGFYNGGTGNETTIKELAETIIEVTGSKSKIEYVKRRKWDGVKTRKANIYNSRKELGYNPEYLNLKDNLEKVVEWYRKDVLGL